MEERRAGPGPRRPPPPRLPRTDPSTMHQPTPGDGRASPHDTFEHAHDDAAAEVRHPLDIHQLVQQIRETADKLARDGASRGDVKLLSTALRELRYSFKVFQAFRERRK